MRFLHHCVFSMPACLLALAMFFLPASFCTAAETEQNATSSAAQQKKMTSADEMTPDKLFNLLRDGAKVLDAYIANPEMPGTNATQRVFNMLQDGAKVVESHFDTSLEASVNATAKLFSMLESTAKQLEGEVRSPLQAGVNATEKLFNQLLATAQTFEKERGGKQPEKTLNYKRLQVINRCDTQVTATYNKEEYPLSPREVTMLLFWQGTPKGETIDFARAGHPKLTEKLSTILAANQPEAVDFGTGTLTTYSYTLCPDRPVLP